MPNWWFSSSESLIAKKCIDKPPNPRVQRTRSSRSAPHEPLTRHPLGDEKAGSGGIDSRKVSIPRPIARSERADGGPIRYRVLHTAALWKSGERPQLKTSVLEGDVGLAM